MTKTEAERWKEWSRLFDAKRPQREAAIRLGEEGRRMFYEAHAELLRRLARR
jgi:hypothetical protein